MRQFFLVAAIAVAVTAQPAWLMAGDREVAQQIATKLHQSGKLKDYSVRVKYKDGTAWLSGRVASARQAKIAVEQVKKMPHVKRVVNRLSISATKKAQANRRATSSSAARPGTKTNGVRPVAHKPAGANAPAMAVMPPAELSGEPTPAMPMDSGTVYQNGPRAAYSGAPLPAYVPGAAYPVSPARFDQPYMPNYAWPSYAAYPNYAAVTYPKQYSPSAWPFIGPFYPYPQVPLGWRRVTLEWDDGWWMLDFKQR